MSWSSKKKKTGFFVALVLSEGNFFDICILSQCIVYWIHFQNINTFIYQKTLLHTLCCLFLKSFETFQCILKPDQDSIFSATWLYNEFRWTNLLNLKGRHCIKKWTLFIQPKIWLWQLNHYLVHIPVEIWSIINFL